MNTPQMPNSPKERDSHSISVSAVITTKRRCSCRESPTVPAAAPGNASTCKWLPRLSFVRGQVDRAGHCLPAPSTWTAGPLAPPYPTTRGGGTDTRRPPGPTPRVFATPRRPAQRVVLVAFSTKLGTLGFEHRGERLQPDLVDHAQKVLRTSAARGSTSCASNDPWLVEDSLALFGMAFLLGLHPEILRGRVEPAPQFSATTGTKPWSRC
jgi:hypothetical protein